MAYFLGLARAVVVGLLCVAGSGLVIAADCIKWSVTAGGAGIGGPACGVRTYLDGTPAGAVAQWLAYINGACQPPASGYPSYHSVVCPAVTPGVTTMECTYKATLWNGSIETRTWTPVTRVTEDCVCELKEGQAPNGLFCTGTSCRYYVPGSTESAGLYGGGWDRMSCFPLGEGNSDGCVVASEGMNMAWFDKSANLWAVDMRDNTFTGASCTVGSDANSAAPGEPPIAQDKVGKCPGTVNGVEVWVPCDQTMTPTAKEETKFDPATGQTTKTTTQKDTQCAMGSCTTSSTVTVVVTASGGGTGTTTVSTGSETQAQSEYCRANPGAKQCQGSGTGGDGGSFGGACNAGFACTGDAVICATARATNELNCSFKPSPEGDSILAGITSSEPSLSSSTVALGQSSFSSASDLPAGVGMEDKAVNVSVGGYSQTVTIEFSKVNPWMAFLGNLMLALAWISAAAIVFRR